MIAVNSVRVLLPLPGEDDLLFSLGEILFSPMQEL